MTWVSDCCSAPLTVSGDTSQHYVCGACGKPCDREPEDECDGGDHLAETQDWTTCTYVLAETPDATLPRFPEDD